MLHSYEQFLCTQGPLDNTIICFATVLQRNSNSNAMAQGGHTPCKPRPMPRTLWLSWAMNRCIRNRENAAQRTSRC